MKAELLPKTEPAIRQTRETWFGKIRHLFDCPRVEEEMWQKLEELLILADVGVVTTEKLIQRVKQRAKEEKLSQGYKIRSSQVFYRSCGHIRHFFS